MTGKTRAILDILIEADDYISGQQISDSFDLSRSAIWKHMNKLKAAGYEIESVTHKGYKLLAFPEGFSSAEIDSDIEHLALVDQVLVYDTLGSTNDEAKILARDHEDKEILIIAEEQVSGRGRRGRQWESPKASGIYMSLLLRPDLRPNQASMMTLIAGLALSDAIKSETGLEASIKWPNDIVIAGKKVCGILTEMSAELNEIHYLVVGIGINVNTQVIPESIISLATSLSIEVGDTVNRKTLLKAVLTRFNELYRQFIDVGDLSFLMDSYNASCITVGREVKVTGKESWTGFAKAVLADGGLLVEKEGKDQVVYAGEVSVRGLYGYV